MIDLMRRRQKEEIMHLLKDEELRERDRLDELSGLTPQEKAAMQGRFNIERRQAQQRIEQMIKIHEAQREQYKMQQSTH